MHDVVVIGGGITGVGIAQALAAAGYNVTLWEKNTIGSQTSSNSSKLIHGGLRYLETGQISLVRQCLKERMVLLNLAPSLVHPEPFYIPVYSENNRGFFKIFSGLSLYALLNEFDALSKFEIVPSQKWENLTDIKNKNLKAIFKYWDAQTDDKLLTQAVARSAQELGVDIQENIDCISIYHGAYACELAYINQRYPSDSMDKIKSSIVINATGPWVNELLTKVSPQVAPLEVDFVQGSHLLIDIPSPKGVFYLESYLDKRMIFVMPWEGKTLLGTTEIELESVPDSPQISQQEQNYLLAIYCHYFTQYYPENLASKIIKSYSGVRVLPKAKTGVFKRPRETLIQTFAAHPCLLAVYGGKLTSFRTTAKEIVSWVESRLGPRKKKADIDSLIIK